MNYNKNFIILIMIITFIAYSVYLEHYTTERFVTDVPMNSDSSYIDNCDQTGINVHYNDCIHLVSKTSKYQEIDVYNHKILGNILVIDDDLQITENDEKNYHEMIVHTALNYIPDAKNVLIIGGGDGGTVTEVLKHKNLKHITNVDIDQDVINIAKEYFPQIGKSFDDPRVNLVIDDAKLWLDKNKTKYLNFYDAIILDITDFGASESLTTYEFFQSINKLLKNTGIVIMNYESLGWFENDLKDFKTSMKPLFNNIFIYQLFQPTYHGGHYSFAFMSKTIDPTNTVIDWKKFEDKKIKTKYYTEKIHRASFCLPNKVLNKLQHKSKTRFGLLTTYDIVVKDNKKIDNINNMNHFFDAVLKHFKLSELQRIHHKFDPQGLTMISLLKESHLSIHTWPENNSACIDLFTCGKFVGGSFQMKKLLKKYFDTVSVRVNQVDRVGYN